MHTSVLFGINLFPVLKFITKMIKSASACHLIKLSIWLVNLQSNSAANQSPFNLGILRLKHEKLLCAVAHDHNLK